MEPNYTLTRQRDSVAVLICPLCAQRRYVNQDALNLLKLVQGIKTERVHVNDALFRHKPCNAVMSIVRLPADIGEPVTVNDLCRVAMKAWDGHRWINTNAREATDAQFDRWIKLRMTIHGIERPTWTLAERADACDVLVQRKQLQLAEKGGVLSHD